MFPITVSDYFINRIAADGVDTVFSLSGGGIMYLIDSLARSKAVRFIPVHHEEFAGVAADGYARSGKPYGVAMGTTGPGAAHLFAAIAAAWQDSSPVVFIVGQVKSADSSYIQGIQTRQNGTFEFDTTKSFAPISKFVAVISTAQQAPELIEEALRISQEGRPGPVVLEIPLDIQGTLINSHDDYLEQKKSKTFISNGEGELLLTSKLTEQISNAKKPLVLLGSGVARANEGEKITKALRKYNIPYVVTQLGREIGNLSHPLYLGSPGVKANRSANLALVKCDLLIIIGCSLHQQVIGWDADVFRNAPSWKIWFEQDMDVLGTRNDLVNESFNLSVQTASRLLQNALGNLVDHHEKWMDWKSRCLRWRECFLLHFPKHDPVNGRMCLYQAITELNRRAQYFSAAVTDAGIVWYALAQHFFPAPGSYYVSSGSFGAMGMALPMAIGAAAATKGPVLALTGDGSLMMCLSELATLRSSKLPVLLVINNNDGYLSIKSTHDRFFGGLRIGTDGSNGTYIPEYREIAKVFGIQYLEASSVQQLSDCLDSVLDVGLTKPVILEIMTFIDQAVEPLVTSRRGEDGKFLSSSLADMDPVVEDIDD
jgi:acetolactate synthase-1/2/3 large subunit